MDRLNSVSRILVAALLAAFASGCQNLPTAKPRPAAAASVTVEEGEAWRSDASAADVEKLGQLTAVWSEALAEAKKAGFTRRMTAEGPLLEPSAGLPRGAPPPGVYSCRMIRVGALAPRGRAFTAARQGFCYVGLEDGQLSLSADFGAERAGGYLWEEKDGRRTVFLGASARSGTRNPPAYGSDPARDLAGLVERIGNLRYRLVVPGYGAKITVFELTPAASQ